MAHAISKQQSTRQGNAMIYNTDNCAPRTLVYDVETKRKIRMVKQVDTETMTVTAYSHPLIVCEGDLLCDYLEFTTIYPIFGGSHAPVMFHCYGRKN